MAKRSTRRRHGLDAPTCNCLLLCDEVLESKLRPKHILHGIIGVIGVSALPATVGPFVAYVRLSNVKGNQKVKLNLQHGGTGAVIIETEVAFPQQSDPLGVYNLIIPTPQFVVQTAGRYIFNITYDDVPITQSPILIQELNSRDAQ